jgi:hydrogenase maturation protease HycI
MPNPGNPNLQLTNSLRQNLLDAERVAVIGVGSELRGDDIAGVAVAETLGNSKKRPATLAVFAGHTAPENITGEVRRFLKGRRGHIILVDAADMGTKPGTVRLLSHTEIGGTSFSTHVLPLAILISYLRSQLKCGISVIGIQPRDTAFGKKPSSVVTRAVKAVCSSILAAIPKTARTSRRNAVRHSA